MKTVLKTIKDNNLISHNEKIGIAVSGGIDSMCLLHYLINNQSQFDCEFCVININHKIRKTSKNDSNFVKNYCKQNNIKFFSFDVDALKFSAENKLTIEEGARICRYNVFDNLIKKNVVDKIVIAHHKQDQAETIFLNLLRGTGLKGASGMEVQNNHYIRPMLFEDKCNILAYQKQYEIPFVEDETNEDTNYSRNFIRRKIFPLIKTHWNNFESNILNFSKICKQDNDYIESLIDYNKLLIDDNLVKIPLSYFVYDKSIVFRVLRKALRSINALKDIEQKHLILIDKFANENQNGTKLNLPNAVIVSKEYDCVVLSKKIEQNFSNYSIPFKVGKHEFLGRNIEIKKVKNANYNEPNTLFFDLDKIPKKSVIRTKQTKDMFTKFGGGTKSLKDYLIDKKIPLRTRNSLPILCFEQTVLLIAGVEISENIKIDCNTKNIGCLIIKN